ncbi:MAG: hypothetical protein KDA78_18460, partial [Planctomycetaceae bacterium]|nr:hypothetical protein [Planctomycetaceae bacterium]
PALSLRLRNRFFGLSGKRTSLSCRALNGQVLTLSRVVLDPKYRGAGLSSSFVRRSCELSGSRFVEAVAEMGRVNPFFERAGFLRVGSMEIRGERSRRSHSGIYGTNRKGRSALLSEESHRKSRFAHPEYFIWQRSALD